MFIKKPFSIQRATNLTRRPPEWIQNRVLKFPFCRRVAQELNVTSDRTDRPISRIRLDGLYFGGVVSTDGGDHSHRFAKSKISAAVWAGPCSCRIRYPCTYTPRVHVSYVVLTIGKRALSTICFVWYVLSGRG